MKKRGLFIFLLLVVALGVLGAWWFQPTNVQHRFYIRRSQRVESWHSQPSIVQWEKAFRSKTKRATLIFKQADKLEAFRIAKSLPGAEPGKGVGKVDGFPYAYKKELGIEFTKRFASLILSPKTYTGLHKACGFDPLVAFRARHKNETATFVICFGCNELALVENDPKLPITGAGYYVARVRLIESFDDYRPELIAFAQEAFPHDMDVQKLKH